MNVRNGRCIRNLSLKQMKAGRSRNRIAIFAIALTTLLFTALFTVGLSILSSYEEYSFRQIGGYCHGTFKEVSEEQIAALSSHSKVKEYGLRTVCGVATEAPFAKVPAEISWMDANTAKWSYATPTTGRMPESGMEIAMDTAALEQLGITPELGVQVALTYQVGTGSANDPERTDVFTLVGFWDYDDLLPVHYINVSKEYVEQIEADYLSAGGESFRTDMNVMLPSSVNIQETMEQIDTDLGYQWEDRNADNCVRIGTNWGYTASEVGSSMDAGTVVAITAFLILVIFTGYLIIYNIFQISVSNDIRHYGLLKTIGTTPRQLRRIVRLQALYLSVIGIPLGCLLGYGVGGALVPSVMASVSLKGSRVSTSPIIFIGAAVFALITVLISCSKPGKKAGRVTPVEALRYTEGEGLKKKQRSSRRAGLGQMAYSNLGRSKTKMLLVVLSLSLAVVLLNCVAMFVNGFDMEKYLSQYSVSDFLVGTTEYFQYRGYIDDAGLSDDQLHEIRENTLAADGGCVYATDGMLPICWLDEKVYRDNSFCSGDLLEQQIANAEHRDGKIGSSLMLEGFDDVLLDKLFVYDGDLAPLTDPGSHAIAVAASHESDDGEIDSLFRVGDVLTVTYVEEGKYIDTRTGDPADDTTEAEFVGYRTTVSHDVEYTVCAIVGVPYSMSFRAYLSDGVSAILNSRALFEDSGGAAHPMLYVFDAPDEAAETAAEEFLSSYTDGDSSGLMYESKALLRKAFDGFRSMFLLVGGVLCFIVGLVGILNFFNAILTGILTRRREFAMLQAVGMTGKQLKRMLILEGLFYAIASGAVSLLLTLIVNPVAGKALENICWFFSYRVTIWPVLAMIPVFLLLGILLPFAVYHFTAKQSIIERIREAEI